MNLVMNGLTHAVWEYASYPYNSFFEFNGKYYATGDGGLYQIETGDLDGATQIDASWSFGRLAFNKDNITRVSDAYVGGTIGSTLELTVATDAGQSATYEVVPYQTDVIQPSRVKLGKGLRGKYYQLSFNNVDGCNFSVDSVTVDSAASMRRV